MKLARWLFLFKLIEDVFAFHLLNDDGEAGWGDFVNPKQNENAEENDHYSPFEFKIYPCDYKNNHLGLRLNRSFKIVTLEENSLFIPDIKVGDTMTKVQGNSLLTFPSFEEAMLSIQSCLNECTIDTPSFCVLSFLPIDKKIRVLRNELSETGEERMEVMEYDATFRTDKLPGFNFGFDLSVTSFSPNSVAEKMGIKVGDTLISINGNSLSEMSSSNVQKLLRDSFTTHQIKCRGPSYCSMQFVRSASSPKVLRFRVLCSDENHYCRNISPLDSSYIEEGSRSKGVYFLSETGKLDVFSSSETLANKRMSINFASAIFSGPSICERKNIILATPKQGCFDLKNEGDVRGSYVVLRRGGCSFYDKSKQVEMLGAKGVIIINNGGDVLFRMPSEDPSVRLNIPAILISQHDGSKLENILNANRDLDFYSSLNGDRNECGAFQTQALQDSIFISPSGEASMEVSSVKSQNIDSKILSSRISGDVIINDQHFEYLLALNSFIKDEGITGNVIFSDPLSGCYPAISKTKDVTDQILLIQRGECSYTEKYKNAVSSGAKAVIIWNDTPGIVQMKLDLDLKQMTSIPMIMVGLTSGQQIMSINNKGIRPLNLRISPTKDAQEETYRLDHWRKLANLLANSNVWPSNPNERKEVLASMLQQFNQEDSGVERVDCLLQSFRIAEYEFQHKNVHQ